MAEGHMISDLGLAGQKQQQCICVAKCEESEKDMLKDFNQSKEAAGDASSDHHEVERTCQDHSPQEGLLQAVQGHDQSPSSR